TQRGAGDREQRARPPYRDAACVHIGDLVPANGRAYHFFAATSRMTSISRSRSARSFLSFAFSCSSWRRRFTSTGSSAPKRLRHAYIVASLTPCFFATSATGRLSASRRIFTICSSLKRVFFIGSSSPEEPSSQ